MPKSMCFANPTVAFFWRNLSAEARYGGRRRRGSPSLKLRKTKGGIWSQVNFLTEISRGSASRLRYGGQARFKAEFIRLLAERSPPPRGTSSCAALFLAHFVRCGEGGRSHCSLPAAIALQNPSVLAGFTSRRIPFPPRPPAGGSLFPTLPWLDPLLSKYQKYIPEGIYFC